MPPTGQRQTMLFSATFPKEIQRLAAGESVAVLQAGWAVCVA
jgi:superfamily II DNA/RNA helicase